MSEILDQLSKGQSLDGAKITVTAFVGERFLNLIYSGHARAFIFSSKVKLKFLGSSPQVFKPAMPFKAYAAVSFNDGSPLPYDRLIYEKLEVRPRIQFHRSGSRTLQPILVPMSLTNAGLWEFSINLKIQLREYTVQSRLREVIDITITIEAPSSTNFSQIIHIGEENLSQL